MTIDWFTIAAQALNFFILVALMKKFLYKPILNTIDVREKKAAADLAMIVEKNAQIKKDELGVQNAKLAVDTKREDLLNQAKSDAQKEATRLLAEAQAAANTLKLKAAENLKQDLQKSEQEASTRIYREIFALSRKVLADLAGATLQDRITAVFLTRLQELSVEQKKALANGALIVKTSYELSSAERTSTQNEIRKILGTSEAIDFEKSPTLIGGIELASHGQKVSWSIEEYLAEFEKTVSETSTHVA